MSPHVLVLGGTTEARRLATELAARPGVRVTTSLAGRVSRPGALDGDVRVGGFGGADGLARWLREHRVDAVVDATHPFAAAITANAARAAAATGIPAVVLRRPGWTPGPDDRWHWVGSSPRPPRSCRPWAAVSSSPRAAWALRPSPTSPSSTSSSVRWNPPSRRCPRTWKCCSPGTLHTGRRAGPAARTPGRRAGDQGQRRRGDSRQTDRRTRPRPPRGRRTPPPAPGGRDHRAGRAVGPGPAGSRPSMTEGPVSSPSRADVCAADTCP